MCKKIGSYIQGQGYSNWVCVHTMKSWLLPIYDLHCFLFFFSFFLAFFCDHPCLTVHVHKLECGVKRVPLLWSRSWSRWRFGTPVNVCPDNISDRLNLVWWCIVMSQSIIWEYYFAIFTVIAKIVSARFSEILQRLQSKLVWWYIIARRGKTL